MGNVAQLCTYARIDTLEVPFTGDLMDAWEEPASFFLLSSEQRPRRSWISSCSVSAALSTGLIAHRKGNVGMTIQVVPQSRPGVALEKPDPSKILVPSRN